MIQSIAVAGNRVLLYAVELGKGVKEAAGRVTDAKSEIITHIPQGLGNHACRIGKVKDFHIFGGIAFCQLAILRQSGNGAHGEGETRRAGGLLAQQALAQSKPLIPDAHIVAAHADRGDNVVRIPHRFYRVQGQAERQ